MISFGPLPKKQIRENWDRARTERDIVPAPPRPQNVAAVLDLGNVVYYHFQGRPYGVPTLPVPLGRRIIEAWLDLESFGTEVTRENLAAYYACFERLRRDVWRAMYPTGKLRRLLRFFGLFPNPFLKANEGQLRDAAYFLLLRRMSTGVPALPVAKTKRPRRRRT